MLESISRRKGKPEVLFVSTLEAPLLLMSYSVIAYLFGLAIMVVQPLWSEAWGDESKVCIFRRYKEAMTHSRGS